MEPFLPKNTKKTGPEAKIQEALVKLLKVKDWAVLETHGNMYQSGFPDLYCMHYSYGTRWVEVKNPLGYSFTPAQMEVFPLMTSKGVGIWILTAATEHEYQKLFSQPNWWTFLGVMK